MVKPFADIVLVSTDTLVGYVVTGVPFSTMVAVGVASRRHERRNDWPLQS
ncbi:hypothetical protein GCM10010282_37980 [Streptomyces roseolus]|nr:hypothetical protein GCM10010282_37980 [Streptomyces roseolus]